MKLNNLKEFFKTQLWIYPLIAGFILRFYRLTSSSIWHDEGYTMWLIRYDFLDVLHRTARDVHPPAYYLIAKPWTLVFGSSVFSIRLLSLLFSIGIIYLTYLIVKEVFNKNAAFWSSLFVALSPFMVRFGQEARMYGVVAFFTTLATYFLVKYIKDKNSKYLWLYVPAMIIAMYTQYYSFFVIISHWLILAIYTPNFFKFRWVSAFKEKIGVLNWKWWLANATLLVMYLPWFPVAYRQVTRVSGSYWIKPEWITKTTIPNNILQFISYSHLDDLQNSLGGQLVFWVIIALLSLVGFVFIKKNNYKQILSLYIFGYLPMILVFTLSKLRTPVYQDRYFPFSAIALFVIWGFAISMIKNKTVSIVAGIMFAVILVLGNLNMYKDVNHQMVKVKETVEQNFQVGDKIYSGELYTFLDGAYYLGYEKVKFISDPVDGYGESSLFYDQQGEYVVTKEEARNSGDRIWVIGKTGDKDYYKSENWSGFEAMTYFEEFKNNGLKVVLYTKK